MAEPEAERVARGIYQALRERDLAALQRLLDAGCEARVTEGLPEGVGGPHRGREAVLAMWGRVARLFDIHPEPHEYVAAEGGRLLVLGRYQGKARATGRPVDAAFAHLLTVRDGRLRHLVQITDSHRWRAALEG